MKHPSDESYVRHVLTIPHTLSVSTRFISSQAVISGLYMWYVLFCVPILNGTNQHCTCTNHEHRNTTTNSTMLSLFVSSCHHVCVTVPIETQLWTKLNYTWGSANFISLKWVHVSAKLRLATPLTSLIPFSYRKCMYDISLLNVWWHEHLVSLVT